MARRSNAMPGPDPRVVPILRLAMLGGAGLLGGVVGFLRSQGAVPTATEAARGLTIAGRVLWGVAIAGCLFLAARVRDEREPAKVLAQSIMGWALAESVAIFGAVYWYLLGNSQWYFPGLGFLALALVMLPGVRRA
ncbi:MAG: hypothetical protein ACREOG_05930 [Gemmatimonadaceae bacterium]